MSGNVIRHDVVKISWDVERAPFDGMLAQMDKLRGGVSRLRGTRPGGEAAPAALKPATAEWAAPSLPLQQTARLYDALTAKHQRWQRLQSRPLGALPFKETLQAGEVLRGVFSGLGREWASAQQQARRVHSAFSGGGLSERFAADAAAARTQLSGLQGLAERARGLVASITGGEAVQKRSLLPFDPSAEGAKMAQLNAVLAGGWQQITQGTDTAGDGFVRFRTAASASLSNVMAAAQQTAGQLPAVFSGINLSPSGASIMQGLLQGIESMAERVIGAARRVAGGIMGAIRGVAKIASPSKVTTEMGVFIGGGLAQGLQRSVPQVTHGADRLAEAALPLNTPQLAAYRPESAPAVHSGAVTTVTNHNNPQFTLTVAADANQNDRALEQQVKRWVRDAFRQVIDDAERAAPPLRSV